MKIMFFWLFLILSVSLPKLLAANEANSLVNDEVVKGELTVGDINNYVFTANAGDAVHIRVVDTNDDRFTPRIWLYNPDGTANVSKTANLTLQLNCSKNSRCSIRQSGIYRLIVADESGANPGSYAIHYKRVLDSNENGSLLNDGVVKGELTVGDINSYIFTANAGGAAHIRIVDTNNDRFTPRIWLYNPDGTANVSKTANLTLQLNCSETSRCSIRQSGIYRLVVADENGANPGSYMIHYMRIPGSNGNISQVNKNTPAIPVKGETSGISSVSSSSNLEKQILSKRSAMPSMTRYLFDTATMSSAISTVWSKSTALVRASGDIQGRYDEAYLAAAEYLTLADMELSYASRLLMSGNESAARKHINNHDHLIKMHQLSNDTAVAIYSDDIESAKILARGFSEGSKEALAYGINFAGLGPAGNLAVEICMLSADFAIDFSEADMDEATKNLVKNVIIKTIMNKMEVTKDTTTYIGKSGLYNELANLTKDPEISKQLMTFISKSTAHGANTLGKESVDKITDTLNEYYGI